MTVRELADILEARQISQGDAARDISGGMVCDVMSLSLARGFGGMAWVCQRTDINALAVAVMTDAACVVFAECMQIDEELAKRANAEKINVLMTSKSAFEVVGQMYASGIRAERSRK